MSEIVKELMYILPHKLAHKILYKKTLGKELNLSNPNDFNEKIQYLMLNEFCEKETNCSDKVLVREYIEEKGYKEILTKLYGVWDNANDINIDKLPARFVLKTNNGSGDVRICIQKEMFNFEKVKKELNRVLHKNFAKELLEYQYEKIEPKIICEEFLGDRNGELPIDYKFYCYDGHVECVLICSERSKSLKLDYFNLNWDYLDYSKKEYRSNETFEKPKNFEKMIEISSELSKGFKFVRVDLYNLDGKIYFGELTFSPMAGLVYYNTPEALEYLGKLIKIGNER